MHWGLFCEGLKRLQPCCQYFGGKNIAISTKVFSVWFKLSWKHYSLFHSCYSINKVMCVLHTFLVKLLIPDWWTIIRSCTAAGPPASGLGYQPSHWLYPPSYAHLQTASNAHAESAVDHTFPHISEDFHSQTKR